MKMRWWDEARFGMFIHWGLYSILGRGEWVMYVERIPVAEYAKLADKFKPPKSFTPEVWVKLAKEAGMRYMVFTTRHHDGFCLFDSKVSDFTSVKTAAKRDFVAEYVDACKKYNMRIGLYYSLIDWRFPGAFNRGKYPVCQVPFLYRIFKWKSPGAFDREKYSESFEKMVEQAHQQVRELMTNYGRIDYLFYDGEWIPGVRCNRSYTKSNESPEIAKLWRAKELNAMVRKLQPEIMINNRAGTSEDVDTPEHHIVASDKNRAWESNTTIGDWCTWGYTRHNPNMKPTTQLIQDLVACASKAGNYLLNIGPKPDGSVREEEVERLKAIGTWLNKNGEAIYGSEYVPNSVTCIWGSSKVGMITAKGNIAYLHIFRWQGETITLTGVKNKVYSARILGIDEKIRVYRDKYDRVVITGLPVDPPDNYGTVIALELDGKPEAVDYSKIPIPES
ncbi:MAG: alpha-L-fucosidase [bacterium]|nr:alpha-L-fucosidase [bacterium]